MFRDEIETKKQIKKWLKILIKRIMIKLDKKIKWDKMSWDKIQEKNFKKH
jgi:hypothetical protein